MVNPVVPARRSFQQKEVRMTRFRTLLVCSLLLLVTTALAAADAPKAPSLYSRLGGYDAIAAVTDDFIGRLATDEHIGKKFSGPTENEPKNKNHHPIDNT